MNKTLIIWLVVAVCLVLIGGAVFCLAMAANHWDFSLLNSDKMETNTYDVTEDFQSISIHSETEAIEFRLSDDGKCRVVCLENEKEKHDISVQNGTLSIEQSDSAKWYEHVHFFSVETPAITVYLPKAEYASLLIKESTGTVTIPQDFLFGSMDIHVSTGDIDCRSSSSGLIRIKTSTGDILAENLSAGELELSASTGHITVQSVVCGGNVGASVSTGKVNLTDVSCRSLSSTGDTGDITMNNVIAAETISIDRSTGDVRFEQCDAGELTIETR